MIDIYKEHHNVAHYLRLLYNYLCDRLHLSSEIVLNKPYEICHALKHCHNMRRSIHDGK